MKRKKVFEKFKSIILIFFAAFYLLLSRNEYIFSSKALYLLISMYLICCIVLKYFFKKKIAFFRYLFLLFTIYNFHLVLGGFLFIPLYGIIGWSILTLAILFIINSREKTWTRYFCDFFIISGIAGFVFLYLGRNQIINFKGETLDRDVRILDKTMHPYEIILDEKAGYIYAAYGIEGKIGWIPIKNSGDVISKKKKSKLVDTGRSPQRICIEDSGNGKNFILSPLWGRWGKDEKLLKVNLQGNHEQNSRRNVAVHGELPLSCCKNAFEAYYEPRRESILVLCEVNSALLRLNEETGEMSRCLELGGMNSYDLEVSVGRDAAYVSDWLYPYLIEVDLNKFQVSRKKFVGISSFGLAVDEQNGILYVARPFVSRVDRIDLETFESCGNYKAGFGVRDIEIWMERNMLVAGNYFDGTVDILDLTTGERVVRVNVGRLVRGVAIDRINEIIYAATACGIKYFDVDEVIKRERKDKP